MTTAAITHAPHPTIRGRLLCRPNREPDKRLHGIAAGAPTCNDCQRTLTAAGRIRGGRKVTDIPRRNVPPRDVATALAAGR